MDLHKVPLGLLGALDLKTLGRNPTAFGDSIAGVVELLDFYTLVNRAAETVATGGLTAPGSSFGVLTVPQGIVWRVKTLSVICARNAADAALNIECNLSVIGATEPTGAAIFSPRFDAVAATDLTQVRALYLARPLLLGPGDRITSALRTTLSMAGTLGFTANVDIFPV